MKAKNYQILVLEDDISSLRHILQVLENIEQKTNVMIAVTILPDYEKTETYINNNPEIKYDILLLDRDCFMGGSFHVVDLSLFDLDKAISISSVPEYNIQAQSKGVRHVIWKDYQNLDQFSQKLEEKLLEIIHP